MCCQGQKFIKLEGTCFDLRSYAVDSDFMRTGSDGVQVLLLSLCHQLVTNLPSLELVQALACLEVPQLHREVAAFAARHSQLGLMGRDPTPTQGYIMNVRDSRLLSDFEIWICLLHSVQDKRGLFIARRGHDEFICLVFDRTDRHRGELISDVKPFLCQNFVIFDPKYLYRTRQSTNSDELSLTFFNAIGIDDLGFESIQKSWGFGLRSWCATFLGGFLF